MNPEYLFGAAAVIASLSPLAAIYALRHWTEYTRRAAFIDDRMDDIQRHALEMNEEVNRQLKVLKQDVDTFKLSKTWKT